MYLVKIYLRVGCKSMNCKKCGAKLHEDANFCMRCGAKVDIVITCQNCGTELPEEAAFCFKCGAKQLIVAEDNTKYNHYISDYDAWENTKLWIDRDNLHAVYVKDGVQKCPDFYNFKQLRVVRLPETITYIGKQAFCLTAIEKIVIPNSVTEIGSHAFEACERLTYVKMSNNIKEISMFAFLGCSKLQYIEYKEQKLSVNKFMELMKNEGKSVFD